METWVLLVALLYKHPALASATSAVTHTEFASAEACTNALQKVKAEWGSPTGVNVYAVCVPTGFKK
jgi:hypothetical protein